MWTSNEIKKTSHGDTGNTADTEGKKKEKTSRRHREDSGHGEKGSRE